MKLRNLSLISATFLLARIGFGQAEEPPKTDVFVDYSYIQFNPTLTGLQSRAFNGGGGGLDFFFGKYFGARAEFQGYSSTTWTLTTTGPIVTPHGTIPPGSFSSNGNMFTYLFGPEIRFPSHRFTVFGDVLFGGSNSNAYGNLAKSIVNGGGNIAVSGTQHPFTMAVGGGVDINFGRNFAVRAAELDYLLTRYTNFITQTNNQNNFRYLGGVVFRFR
jgi:hypothetical protein